MAILSGFQAGLDFQPGGGVNPGGVGRDALSTGGAEGFAESSAAHNSAFFAASASAVAVDTAAVVVDVDDELGEMPRCWRRDFLFDVGADDGGEVDASSLDTAAVVEVAADDVVAVAVVGGRDGVVDRGLRRHDGYP